MAKDDLIERLTQMAYVLVAVETIGNWDGYPDEGEIVAARHRARLIARLVQELLLGPPADPPFPLKFDSSPETRTGGGSGPSSPDRPQSPPEPPAVPL